MKSEIFPRITVDPQVCCASRAEILADYPYLEDADISAAVRARLQ